MLKAAWVLVQVSATIATMSPIASLRLEYHLGTQCVAFNVTASDKEVTVILDGETLEAALIQMWPIQLQMQARVYRRSRPSIASIVDDVDVKSFGSHS